MTIRIVLADDHQIVRKGLSLLLNGERDMEVVAEACDGRCTVDLVRELNPDVVVMDVVMPGLNGIEAARRIAAEREDIAIVALSMHSEQHFVKEMLRAGARAFLLKDCATQELIEAIHTVVDGRFYLGPSVSNVVLSDYIDILNGKDTASSNCETLTRREREVLQLIAEGNSSRQISEMLGLSIKTIESHRYNIMEKLHLHSVAQLTKYAIREGITSTEI